MGLNTLKLTQLVLRKFTISKAYRRYGFITPCFYRLIDSFTKQRSCRVFLIFLYKLEDNLSVMYRQFNIVGWLSSHYPLENATTAVINILNWSSFRYSIIYRLQYSFHLRLYNPYGWMVKVKVPPLRATTGFRAGRCIVVPSLRPRHWRWGWVASTKPRLLNLWERPGTHCTGCWVCTRAGLDGCWKSRPNQDSIPEPSTP